MLVFFVRRLNNCDKRATEKAAIHQIIVRRASRHGFADNYLVSDNVHCSPGILRGDGVHRKIVQSQSRLEATRGSDLSTHALSQLQKLCAAKLRDGHEKVQKSASLYRACA